MTPLGWPIVVIATQHALCSLATLAVRCGPPKGDP